MIYQVLMHMDNAKVTQQTIAQIKATPGLVVKSESTSFPYTLHFETPKKMTLKKLGLASPWVVAPVSYIEKPTNPHFSK